jgi:integrase
MKAGKEHRVPLSDAALAVLKAVAMLRDPERGDWVFPGSEPGTALSNMAMLMMLRRMKHRNLTVHDFAAHSVTGARRPPIIRLKSRKKR